MGGREVELCYPKKSPWAENELRYWLGTRVVPGQRESLDEDRQAVGSGLIGKKGGGSACSGSEYLWKESPGAFAYQPLVKSFIWVSGKCLGRWRDLIDMELSFLCGQSSLCSR